MNRFAAWFIKITAWPVQFACFRTKVYYLNKKKQSKKLKGSCIIVSNHTSVYDFVTWMFTFYRRDLRCLVAEIMFQKNLFISTLLKWLGAIKVERDAFDFSFVDKCAEIIEKGGVVEVFPESRIPLPGEKTPLPFKPSAAYIAYRTGAPILPVYTIGSYFKLKRNRAIIGEKLDTKKIIDPSLSEKENIERINQAMLDAILILKNELEKTNS